MAACLAYPDYENEEVIAYLENRDNFCSKARLPVASKPTLRIDVESIEIEDGIVFIFGTNDS